MGLCCVAQDVSEDRRVRQNDSKALDPGLWDHYRWACYISYRASRACNKCDQTELLKHQNSGPGAMKVLVVLVLAVFGCCSASLFYADAPKPQLEVLTDAFWDYVAKATQTADDTLQSIRKSQFGQDVSARLTESADIASSYAVSLHTQLPPTAQDLIAKVTTEADNLKERLAQDLSTAREMLQPYAEEMKAQIQQRVEQLKQELAAYADSVDSEGLRATLVEKIGELKTSLDQNVKDLQAQLGPYTDDLKQKVDQHLQDFKDRVLPMTQQVQGELSQRAQQVQQMAAPYVEELREKLDPYAQDLQARLISLYESFVKGN